MPRSGSTLHYQLATTLAERYAGGEGLGWVNHGDCRELVAKNASGRMQVLKVHHRSQLTGVEDAIARGEATCLYTYRDIRDVAVSLMRLKGSTFANIAFRDELPLAAADFRAWTSLDDVLVTRYEDMVGRLGDEVLRVAHHLKLDISENDAASIANYFEIEQQRKRLPRSAGGTTPNYKNYDAKSLLHENHIFSGESGQWRTLLSPKQIGYLEDSFEHWLKAQGYELSQPFPVRLAGRMSYMAWRFRQALGRVPRVVTPSFLARRSVNGKPAPRS